MDREFLYFHYGVKPERMFTFSGYPAFSDHLVLYLMIEVYEKDRDELFERHLLSQFLRNQNVRFVPAFVPARDGNYVVRDGERYFVLLRLEQWNRNQHPVIGAELAAFHYRGFYFQESLVELNRVGKWQEYWEGRFDSLEKLYQQVLKSGPATEFDEWFLQTFSYFSGLAENAIGYVHDTLLDAPPGPFDRGTICHERFTPAHWVGRIPWKNPFEWVYDHPVRDLAEYVRVLLLRGEKGLARARKFIEDYQSILPLSGLAWRLMFSRLLFPVHYFTVVEEYYYEPEKKGKRKLLQSLQRYAETSEAYERFLANFSQVFQIPVNRIFLPLPEWLLKKSE